MSRRGDDAGKQRKQRKPQFPEAVLGTRSEKEPKRRNGQEMDPPRIEKEVGRGGQGGRASRSKAVDPQRMIRRKWVGRVWHGARGKRESVEGRLFQTSLGLVVGHPAPPEFLDHRNRDTR
ncbi:MAG: hypothetical protein IH881_12240 [Myxococcales bacterium]|nr:hypothetical protein [Myxococcales bacterium]